MKKENKVKLALINMLSNPDVELIGASNMVDTLNALGTCGYIQGIATGTSTYTITVYNKKNDRRIPTKK